MEWREQARKFMTPINAKIWWQSSARISEKARVIVVDGGDVRHYEPPLREIESLWEFRDAATREICLNELGVIYYSLDRERPIEEFLHERRGTLPALKFDI